MLINVIQILATMGQRAVELHDRTNAPVQRDFMVPNATWLTSVRLDPVKTALLARLTSTTAPTPAPARTPAHVEKDIAAQTAI